MGERCELLVLLTGSPPPVERWRFEGVLCGRFCVGSIGVCGGCDRVMGLVLWGAIVLVLRGCLKGLEWYDFCGNREGVMRCAGVIRVRVCGCACMGALIAVGKWMEVFVSIGVLVGVVGGG